MTRRSRFIVSVLLVVSLLLSGVQFLISVNMFPKQTVPQYRELKPVVEDMTNSGRLVMRDPEDFEVYDKLIMASNRGLGPFRADQHVLIGIIALISAGCLAIVATPRTPARLVRKHLERRRSERGIEDAEAERARSLESSEG